MSYRREELSLPHAEAMVSKDSLTYLESLMLRTIGPLSATGDTQSPSQPQMYTPKVSARSLTIAGILYVHVLTFSEITI